MSILSRLVPAPMTVDVSAGALGRMARTLADSRVAPTGRVLVVTSGAHGARIAEPLRTIFSDAHVLPDCPDTFDGVATLVETVRGHCFEAVVGVGGGRVLDASKYIATRLGVPSAVVPTTLAHDGIASPVSIMANDSGRGSYGVAAPLVVIVDLDVVAGAPARFIRSGVGDTLSNLCAIDDWELARRVRGEAIDGLAVALARSSATSVLTCPAPLGSGEFLGVLTEALILSGLAMSVAGTSRPCSGACHEISHAMDLLFPDRGRLHGEQVAVGAAVATFLRGDPVAFDRLCGGLRRFGLGLLPQDVGLTAAQLCAAVEKAPSTRPGRYTLLEHLALRPAQIEREIARYVDAVRAVEPASPSSALLDLTAADPLLVRSPGRP